MLEQPGLEQERERERVSEACSSRKLDIERTPFHFTL